MKLAMLSKRTSTRAISKSGRLFTRPHVAPWDRTTVRLSNGYSLLRQQENAVHIASGLPVQPKGVAAVAAVAASGVSCGRQVTDLESFLRFFLFHFIFLSRCFGLP